MPIGPSLSHGCSETDNSLFSTPQSVLLAFSTSRSCGSVSEVNSRARSLASQFPEALGIQSKCPKLEPFVVGFSMCRLALKQNAKDKRLTPKSLPKRLEVNKRSGCSFHFIDQRTLGSPKLSVGQNQWDPILVGR